MKIISNDFEYDSKANTILKYLGTDENVIIPSEMEGEPVTSIGDFAFYKCTGLTSVTIPDSVTEIGSSAFCGCSGLTSITIPDSVKRIANWAFSGCTCLTSITIPDSVKRIANWAFSGCSGLTSVIIPDSVTSIGSSAFYRCTGLASVTIPSNVTVIGESAFFGCTDLTNVSILNSMCRINREAFFSCPNIRSVIYHDYIKNWVKSSSIEKTAIAIGFMESSVNRTEFNEDIIKANKRWLKRYRKKLLCLTAKSPASILYMTREKILDLDDIDTLLDLCRDDVESRALILNYKRENWTQEELEKIENDKINKLFSFDE